MRDDGRPKFAIHTYPNIGDALFTVGPAIFLSRMFPNFKIGLQVRHPWFRDIVGPHAAHQPLKPLFGHCLKTLAEEGGWIPVCATPMRLRPGRSVIAEHMVTICRLPFPAESVIMKEVDRAPAYLGSRPKRRPKFIGVFSASGPGRRWARGSQLVKMLDTAHVPAQEHPRFDDCDHAIAWISSCSVFVGPDSGLTHLAAALGVPVVMILGARFDPTNFPWPKTRHVTSDACPRGPCYLWDSRRNDSPYPFCPPSPVGDGRCGTLCVDAVKLEDVLRAISEALRDA